MTLEYQLLVLTFTYLLICVFDTYAYTVLLYHNFTYAKTRTIRSALFHYVYYFYD